MTIHWLISKCTQVPLFLLAIWLLLIAPQATTSAADWHIYRGPNHDGVTTETDWSSDWASSGPKELWRKSIGIGFSSITVSNGRAYAMGHSGDKNGQDTVFCLDAATGKELWTHRYSCPLEAKSYEGGTLSTPTVDGDAVYTISKMGDLFCLNAATGAVVWQKQVNKELGIELPTWHFSGSPLVMGDMLVFNLGDAGLALNKKTGAVLWQNGKGACGYATPVPFVMDGLQCVAIFGKDLVFGVRLSDGKVLWKYSHKTQYDVNSADPIIVGNEVFVSSGYDKGCAKFTITGSTATKQWENKSMRNHINGSVYWKGYVYGFDESSKLICMDFKDGSVKWTKDGLGKGSLMAGDDDRLIIMSEQGELVIAKADPAKFTVLARAQILPKTKCWTTPTLSGGRIYARNAQGDMVCLDVSRRG
jgi:outer membrane protein assembly factor BamB